MATMETETKASNQDDTTGFIRLNALRPASGTINLIERSRLRSQP